MVMMTYNPRYYPGLMDQVGLSKAKDLLAYLSNANTDRDEKDRSRRRTGPQD